MFRTCFKIFVIIFAIIGIFSTMSWISEAVRDYQVVKQLGGHWSFVIYQGKPAIELRIDDYNKTINTLF